MPPALMPHDAAIAVSLAILFSMIRLAYASADMMFSPLSCFRPSIHSPAKAHHPGGALPRYKKRAL